MAQESVIVITEDDLEPKGQVIHIGMEDLIDDAAIVITAEDIVEDLMRQFITFVSAGLPDVFLRSHPELLENGNRQQIKRNIDQVPDQALKKHLASRLQAIAEFGTAQERHA